MLKSDRPAGMQRAVEREVARRAALTHEERAREEAEAAVGWARLAGIMAETERAIGLLTAPNKTASSRGLSAGDPARQLVSGRSMPTGRSEPARAEESR